MKTVEEFRERERERENKKLKHNKKTAHGCANRSFKFFIKVNFYFDKKIK